MRLSVVIAVKNEEKNIKRTLESVKWADEIVIVDDVSSDKTVEICRLYTPLVFIHDSQGDFHKNKNLGIEKAGGDWILSLDGDEVVSPELAMEIRSAIKNKDMLGYYINRKNFFLGKWIRGCGWYPDYIIRLFRKGITQWPISIVIDDTPKIVDKTRVGYLKNHLLHYSYTSFEQYIDKLNLYSLGIAKQYYLHGVRLNRFNFFIYFFIKPIFVLLYKYIFLRGYKDGWRGLFISFASGLLLFITYAKLWEFQNKSIKQNV
ncbi:MAG: glycosyltransferase family 2 protein [Candidatus Omnitrophica bacterium]|nr:glycosyltransferase family 2 protein [Candidatus Omnitrophota bacterium]